MTAASSLRPRQLTFAELELRYPINCTVDPATHLVQVGASWRREKLRALIVKRGAPPVLVHTEALLMFQRWLAMIESAGLSDRIETSDGGFVPRLKRGDNVPASKAGLSRHARGLAIDINALANKRGTPGAQFGQRGCVRELVTMAYQCGLVWGGDWHGSMIDPMHFEVGAPVL